MLGDRHSVGMGLMTEDNHELWDFDFLKKNI